MSFRNNLFALFLVLFTQNLYSQTDTTISVKSDSIYYRYKPFKLYYSFYIDGKRIFPPYEKKEFLKTPEAVNYFRKYKAQQLTYILSTMAGLFALSWGLDKSANNKPLLITGGSGLLITGYISLRSAGKNMKKAIRVRNAALGYSTK